MLLMTRSAINGNLREIRNDFLLATAAAALSLMNLQKNVTLAFVRLIF